MTAATWGSPPVVTPDHSPLAILLREPDEVARRCRDEDRLRPLAATSLGAILVGAAAFGATLGTFRGGEQIMKAGLKVPLAVAITLAITVPAFYALATAAGRAMTLRTSVALVLAALGRASLMLLAAAPVMWLAIDLGLAYHASALLAALIYATAGLLALSVLIRGLGGGGRQMATALAFVVLLAGVGAQTAWSLRPFLVRPTTGKVPWIQHREGSFADAVVKNMRSAVGIYDTAWHESRRAGAYGERAAARTTDWTGQESE